MTKHVITPDSIAAAKALVCRLCENGHVRMSVPVDFARDEDMLICALIEVAEKSLATPTPAASRAATLPALPEAIEFACVYGVSMDIFSADQMREYALAALEAAQPASPAPLTDDEEAADEWRRLALQFDGHRIQALWHLKALIAEPEKHLAAAAEFVMAPPLSGEQVLADRIAAFASPQVAPAGWKWMTHPSWHSGQPIPVRLFRENGELFYQPFETDACDFSWTERDEQWAEVLAAPVQVAPQAEGQSPVAQVVAVDPPGPDGHGVNWLKGKRPKPGALLYAAPAPVATQDDARDAADPLQGAADWLKAALTPCTPYDIGGRLLIGYNRALRLFHAAPAAKPTEEQGS